MRGALCRFIFYDGLARVHHYSLRTPKEMFSYVFSADFHIETIASFMKNVQVRCKFSRGIFINEKKEQWVYHLYDDDRAPCGYARPRSVSRVSRAARTFRRRIFSARKILGCPIRFKTPVGRKMKRSFGCLNLTFGRRPEFGR